MKTKMKKINLVFFALSAFSLTSCGASAYSVFKGANFDDASYYVCFSNQNYNVRNANKLTYNTTTEYYELKNVTLSSSNDFYVISENNVKFVGSDGDNMKVNDSETFHYNIIFSPDVIFDENTVKDTSYYASNSHITYEDYIPGAYTLNITHADSTISSYSLNYNKYQTAYDYYYLPDVELKTADTIKVTGQNEGGVAKEYTDITSFTTDDHYRFNFTPGYTTSNNDYCYDKDGNFGTGDDYKYHGFIDDIEKYYISFDSTDNIIVSSGHKEETIKIDEQTTVEAYKLSYDEDQPNTEVYKLNEFFNKSNNKKIKYNIYHYSKIPAYYEVIDDDNDEDTNVSKLTASTVGWYTYNLTVGPSNYVSTLSKNSRDFEGYYMIGDFNHQGYKLSDGSLALDEEYKFTKVDSTSEYYTSDYEQYKLVYTLHPEDLDPDDNDFTFYISNGNNQYGNGTEPISITAPGKYTILFSSEHNYSGSNNYKYTFVEDTSIYTSNEINGVNDFMTFVRKWNRDSEASKYQVYNLNVDLDFTNVTTCPTISTFNGIINGNNHTIKGLHYNDDNSTENISLFKLVTKFASIKDLKIEDLNIDASDASYVGFIAKNYGHLENIEIVSGNIIGSSYVGGLVGYNGNYQISNGDSTTDSTSVYGYGILKSIKNRATIKGKINVGGLSGFNGGKIITSENIGEINNLYYSSSNQIYNIGGLSGYSTGIILDSKNSGLVGYLGVGNNVGGLAGLSSGTIYFSSNSKNVYGKNNIGGLIGYYGVESNSNSTSSISDQITNIIDNNVGNNNSSLAYTEESDFATHLMTYSSNEGEINGTSYVGGIIGFNNATDLNIKEAQNTGACYANSGSYVGGIVAYMNGGTITSSMSNAYLESNGSINQYVGGIVGYLNGTIKATYSTSTLVGSSYMGGIVGYATTSGTIESCYANAFFLKKSNSSYLGNIAGYIDGLNEYDATYGERIKYNYYVGSTLVNDDYGGINLINYGLNSKYASQRETIDELTSTDNTLPSVLNHNFGYEKDDDDDNELNYYAGVEDYLPNLKYFSTCDEIEDDEFDDNDNIYDSYIDYFNKYKDNYALVQKEATTPLVKIAFMEWNEDKGDLKEDNYDVLKIVTLHKGDSLPAYPEFKYAVKRNNKYYFDGSENTYLVTWNSIVDSFNNQIIVPNYQKISTSLSSSDKEVLVEGEFVGDTSLVVTKDGNSCSLTITQDGKSEVFENITVKIKANSNHKIYVDGKEVSFKTFGEYLVFNLSSSDKTFSIEEVPTGWNALPLYAKILIPVGSSLALIGLVTLTIVLVKKNKKKKIGLINSQDNSQDNNSNK